MTETYNDTTIKIFDNTTDLAGITTSCLLQMNDTCGQIDKLNDIMIELGIEQISTDISNHIETIDEFEEFISKQDELFHTHKQDIDSIGTKMNEIQEEFLSLENELEQVKIGLTTS